MELLKERIRKDGVVKEGNVLKVDRFLNHQMDVKLFREIGKEFKKRFEGEDINKILTIEASGIGIACVVAEIFDVPVVFAKKTQTKNIAGDVYTTKVESFTHGRVYDIIVSKEFLGEGDRVLLIDDFLANGKALEGLAKLVKDSGAELIGAGVVIEKGFQPGGGRIHQASIFGNVLFFHHADLLRQPASNVRCIESTRIHIVVHRLLLGGSDDADV